MDKLRLPGLTRLFLVLFLLVAGASGLQKMVLEISLSRSMKRALAAAGYKAAAPGDESLIRLTSSGDVVSTPDMQSLLEKRRLASVDSFIVWSFRGVEKASASAMGTDGRHYFVNAFLEGYRPFWVDHPWMPLYAISMRLKYQPDAIQFPGLEDVWQTSRQSFVNTRGDCEDHAILLADWLISCGYEARVVVGRVPGGGHAWVVAFLDGEEFVLEATSKRRYRPWRHFPLAALAVGYEPSIMFDRDFFWVYSGPPGRGSYTGDFWEKRSRFYRGAG